VAEVSDGEHRRAASTRLLRPRHRRPGTLGGERGRAAGEGPAQFTGSGNGHRQHLYRLDGQARDGIIFNTKLDGCGAETKGDGGGYIVVPPSVTTGEYGWLRTGPVPPVPERLHAILPRKADRWTPPVASTGDCCAVPAAIERNPGGYDWLLRRVGSSEGHPRAPRRRATGLARHLSPIDAAPYLANEGVEAVERIIEYDEQNPTGSRRAGTSGSQRPRSRRPWSSRASRPREWNRLRRASSRR